jgi:tetratricopeptide (TPR) repeat protein
MKTRILVAIGLALTLSTGILLSGSGRAETAGFPARMEALWAEVAAEAAPVPEWLRASFDPKTAGLGGVRMGAGGIKEIVADNDVSMLSDDEVRPLLAHFLGHVILSHRLDGVKSSEKAALEAGAHVFAAEVMARRGMRAEAYAKALRNIAAKYKQSSCGLASGVEAVEKKREVIDGAPGVLLYARLALGNGEFDAAYGAYRKLVDALKPYEDPVLFNTLGWLSVMRLSETNPAKVRAQSEAPKEAFDAKNLYVRAFVVPQKPVKVRGGPAAGVPGEIEEALHLFRRAHELAPYWLAPRINELFALDIAVHVYGGAKDQRDAGGRLADALKLSAVTAGPEEKVAAQNAVGVWLAGEGKRAEAVHAFDAARSAIPCEDPKSPNAWTTCWNGWLAESEGGAKPGAPAPAPRFPREAVLASLAKSPGGHEVLLTACRALGVSRDAKRPEIRAKSWEVKKGGLPEDLRKEIGGSGAVPMDVVEKFSQWLEKSDAADAVFQAADGSVLIAKGASAMTIIVGGGGEKARRALKEIATKIDSKLCFETSELPGGSKSRERCCMVPDGGKVAMSCASGDGTEKLVFEIRLDEKG